MSMPMQQSITRSTRPAQNIRTTSLSSNYSELLPQPPPAPTESKQMDLPRQWPTQEPRRSPPSPISYFQAKSSIVIRSRSSQRFRAEPPRDMIISPQISMGQSSSATTDSPSYGCDQPALAPSVSSNYSTY